MRRKGMFLFCLIAFYLNIRYNISILHRGEVSQVFDSFVRFFHIMENMFSRETAILMVIALILASILSAVNAIGVRDSTIKKTGKDTWTIFKYR